MRKALCVGIDCYSDVSDLYGCANDANGVSAALERNGDGTLNFEINLLCATSEKTYITRGILKDQITKLFEDESEIALLYYAGHGSYDTLGGYLCTSEICRPDDGLSLDDVMLIAGKSKAHNKIIILDSCHSGLAGASRETNNFSVLHDGTVILAACAKDQYSSESGGHGVFTSLLIEALYGGAMNLLGEVSPGSIYSYIDRSLGSWEQRPVFKANIKSFVSLRKNSPPIPVTELHRLIEFFESPAYEFPLDPSYEPDKHESNVKKADKAHEEIFAVLQRFVKLGLVVPVGADHMYYAAIGSKSCKLTAQGQHYWRLVEKKTI